MSCDDESWLLPVSSLYCESEEFLQISERGRRAYCLRCDRATASDEVEAVLCRTEIARKKGEKKEVVVDSVRLIELGCFIEKKNS